MLTETLLTQALTPAQLPLVGKPVGGWVTSVVVVGGFVVVVLGSSGVVVRVVVVTAGGGGGDPRLISFFIATS